MAQTTLFPEFRDQFAPTRYPFSDFASLTSNTTGQVIDNDTFLDASLYPIGATTRLHISLVNITPRVITITLADENVDDIAFTTFDPLNPPDLLRFTDVYGRPAGVLVSESLRLSRFSGWDSGDHFFGFLDTEFVASCVIPTPEPGVRGLLTPDAEFVAGDVWLAGDNGVVIRDDGDGNIRVDMVGDPLFVRKLCIPLGEFNPPAILETINNCPPDEFGYFNLTIGNNAASDTILRLNPTTDGTALVLEAIGLLARNV